jgi:hypothetical protein
VSKGKKTAVVPKASATPAKPKRFGVAVSEGTMRALRLYQEKMVKSLGERVSQDRALGLALKAASR